MQFRNLILILVSLATILSITECSSKKTIGGFDSEQWISDIKGCNSHRLSMQRELLAVKFKLRGLDSDDIMDVLGKPDKEELSKRNQKYFIYYMEPGAECNQQANSAPLSLYVRFTAMGIANELVIKPLGS